jgi:hypothetical protein
LSFGFMNSSVAVVMIERLFARKLSYRLMSNIRFKPVAHSDVLKANLRVLSQRSEFGKVGNIEFCHGHLGTLTGWAAFTAHVSRSIRHRVLFKNPH